ncbi:glycine betaine ABC transporter substrate-binding protein [Bosea sp. 117]|uniref:glycine betaine ABC transporter substrate-binding protein n=1 Tax=Bosea sp. 117 TaxID=1125973 RepID=UPI000691EA41|nr:glycine betaine ABC transporter substrate-binding protein [Bosea sp. 117]
MNRRNKGQRPWGVLAVIAAFSTLVSLSLAGTASGEGGATRAERPPPIVKVGSKSDTEGALLGSMIGLILERAGIPVQYRLYFGPTPAVRQAITVGDLDIYPEYTGNAALFFNLPDDPAWRDPGRAIAKARALDAPNGIVWLTPAPANNTWAVAVRQEVAGSNKSPTLDDFARWVSGGGRVRLAASPEFVSSPAALPAFQKAYGFTLSSKQILLVSGGDTADTIKAAAVGKYGVNAAMVYATDGAIAAAGLKVLRDTKGVQPVYQPTPVVRAAVLEAYPDLPKMLAPTFETLTVETLQELNARVQFANEDPRSVAADYLRRRRLLR